MPKVLIVGKTKMGSGVCLGGIVLTNCRSVRLLPQTGYSHPKNTPFKVGDIWDLELKEISQWELTAPHTEDVRVIRKSHDRTLSMHKLKDRILRIADAPLVQPSEVFCGFLQFNQHKRGRIVPKHGVPVFSTGFWRFERALHKRQDDYGNTRYIYCNSDKCRGFDDADLTLDVKYVGCADPIDVIPPGAILRFSLSHFYKDGFWLQLSGWFL